MREFGVVMPFSSRNYTDSSGRIPRDSDFARWQMRSARLVMHHLDGLDNCVFYCTSDALFKGPFERSTAINRGVQLLHADAPHIKRFVIADSDTLISEKSLFEGFESTAPVTLPYHWYYTLTPEATQKVYDKHDQQKLYFHEPVEGEYEHRIQSYSGYVIFDLEAFLDLGGFDTEFKGWGWEDTAMRLKAEHEYGPIERCGDFVNHLWHPRGDSMFGSEDEKRNRKLFFRKYARKYGYRP